MRWRLASVVVVAVACDFGMPACADEGGASFWLLGSYASQAAVPGDPGLSFDTTFYAGTASAGRSVNFVRGGPIEAGLATASTCFMVTPSYAFETLVLGGQFGFGVTMLAGNYASTVSAISVSASGAGLPRSLGDSMTAFGDVIPTVTLKWGRGVHNAIAYVIANVPLGAYDVARQASTGLGRWALDGGAGYTWFDEAKGHELSAVLGVTYNFMNPHTAYQSGVAMHLELSASQYVTERLLIGLVGYVYNQLTPDSGSGARVGPFLLRVAGAGPQFGYDFVLGGRDTSLSVRAYHESAGRNRPERWNTWLTL